MASPTVISKKSSSPNTCCNCSAAVGEKAKVLPVRVKQADGEGEPETWCPACFVHHRAPLEPGRWPAVHAAKCARCDVTSVLHGHANKCGQCRSSALVLLPSPLVVAQA